MPRLASQAGSVRTGILAGCAAVLAVTTLAAGSCGYLVFRAVRMSEPYRIAVDELRRNPAARQALGEPIAEGRFTTGTVGVSNADGEAKLAIPVSGPKGEGTLHVEAVKKSGTWTLTVLRLDPHSGERIDLLPAYELAGFERRCAAGHAASCNMEGIRLAAGKDGRWGPATEEKAAAAVRAWDRSCDLGNADGCANLGSFYMGGMTGVVGEDPPRAAALLERGCAGKNPKACSDLGVLLQRGRGVRADPARAAALYTQACDGGYALGCINLGELHVRGVGVPRDRERAGALFLRACAAKDEKGCARFSEVSGIR